MKRSVSESESILPRNAGLTGTEPETQLTLGSGIDPAKGDWLCPNDECYNWNWAKRNECVKCFTMHPKRKPDKHQSYADKVQDQRAGLDTGRKFATGDGQRAGFSGGYREVDDEALGRQKRRREEKEDEKEERKKTKTKCKYCKRFACIC